METATTISTTSSIFSILKTPKFKFLPPSKFNNSTFTPPKHTISISTSKKSNLSFTPKSSLPTLATSSPKNLKSRLHNGETLYGIFLLTFSPTIAEIAALSGYDFAVVDMEHGHGGVSDALRSLHALAAAGTAAILRVPETSATWAKKALDLGPQGIMFPMIESSEDAKKAVSFCRFPPAGIRGSAHPIVRASAYGIDEGYLSNFLDELLVMCQVESEEGVRNCGEICGVEGVDCVQMGPLDLSASMGYLWDPGNKKVREALRGAERAVLESGEAYLAGFALPHDPAVQMGTRGYRMVSGATDVGLFRSVAVEDVKRFKMSLEGGSSDDDENKEEDCDDKKYWSE